MVKSGRKLQVENATVMQRVGNCSITILSTEELGHASSEGHGYRVIILIVDYLELLATLLTTLLPFNQTAFALKALVGQRRS